MSKVTSLLFFMASFLFTGLALADDNAHSSASWYGQVKLNFEGERYLPDFGFTVADGTPVRKTVLLVCRDSESFKFCADVWNSESLNSEDRDAIHETDYEAEGTWKRAFGNCDFSSKVALFEVRGLDPIYQLRGKISCPLQNSFSSNFSAETIRGGFEAEVYRIELSKSWSVTEKNSVSASLAAAHNTNEELGGTVFPITLGITRDVKGVGTSLYTTGHFGERRDFTIGLGFSIPIN